MQTELLIIVFVSIGSVYCNCGCLKCNKHLQIVSPPHLPYKVIFRGVPTESSPISTSFQNPLPFEVQVPLYSQPAPPPSCGQLEYKLETLPFPYKYQHYPRFPENNILRTYSYKVETPIFSQQRPPCSELIARPDRVVIPDPNLAREAAQIRYYSNTLPINYQNPQLIQIVANSGPNFEKLPEKFCEEMHTSRYDQNIPKHRSKRHIPLISDSIKFLVGLLPNFIRFPFEQTLKAFQYHQKTPLQKYPMSYFHNDMRHPYYHYNMVGIPSKFPQRFKVEPLRAHQEPKPTKGSLLYKLEKINHDPYSRYKRSLMINDDDEINFPFLKVTSVELDDNDLDESEDESFSEEDEMVDETFTSDRFQSDENEDYNEETEYMKPFNFHNIIPHNPIFYILNTPIRILRQFHQFGKQISPVFKSVPHVLINSKRYLKDFGRSFKNDVLNMASNLIGDFDEVGSHYAGGYPHHRYRRSLQNSTKLEPYEPEYTLVFHDEESETNNHNLQRSKRYILKVCDEDEVEQYLREKLSDLVGDREPKQMRKKKSASRETSPNKRKLVVEKLSSKLIIDNNGLPFVEIDGSKRPLLFKNKILSSSEGDKNESGESAENADEPDDVRDKISALIDRARGKIDIVGSSNTQMYQNEVSVQIIKDKMKQILLEAQDLINIDFEQYSTIYNDLCKLQSFKEFLVDDWKKILINDRSDIMGSQIRILNDFKEMQGLKDKAVSDIGLALSKGSSFMTKKLIKMLVRLQKLQCIIYRVLEDFDKKIQMGTASDIGKEIKYAELLSGLHFVAAKSKHNLENDLKEERDKALDNEMTILEKLRSLLENFEENDSQNKLYEEAKLLWEIKNLEKLQQDSVKEMNYKIAHGQKVRKELKILFDLLRQLEVCEERQKTLFNELLPKYSFNVKSNIDHNKIFDRFKDVRLSDNYKLLKSKMFPRRTVTDERNPLKFRSNGYGLKAF